MTAAPTLSCLVAGLIGGAAGLVIAVTPVRGLELTGVLVYKATLDAHLGPFWNTSIGDKDLRPLGLLEAPPPAVRTAPLENAFNGAIDKPLLPGPHIITLLWQYEPGEFPLVMMVLSLYFNGNEQTPGISAVIPGTTGFTDFSANSAPTAFSMQLQEVTNTGALFFDDGTALVRLGVAFYLPSGGVTDRWRPTDFIDLDRVSLNDYGADDRPDGVLVCELVVGPSPQPPALPAPPGRAPLGVPAVAVEPRVGEDLWVVPLTPTLPLVLPTPTGSGATAATPASEESEVATEPTLAADASVSPAPNSTSTPHDTPRPVRTPRPRDSLTPAVTATPATAAADSPTPSVRTPTPEENGTDDDE